MSQSLQKTFRVVLTLAALALAGALVAALWNAYVLAPGTRDGRVSAHVVRVAPEVSGTVAEVAVDDNQPVKRGDVLYRCLLYTSSVYKRQPPWRTTPA